MVIANFIGILFFLLLLWKKLKDDYHYEKIFNLGLISLLCLLIFDLTSTLFLPEFKFWLQLTGLSLGFGIGIYLQKIRFYESFNALVISILPWFGLRHLSFAINELSLMSFVVFWISLFLIFLYFFIESFYRKFIWYKSGRVGFSGLLIAGIFFILQVFVLVSSLEKYISAAIAFIFFLLLYKLSKSKE